MPGWWYVVSMVVLFTLLFLYLFLFANSLYVVRAQPPRTRLMVAVAGLGPLVGGVAAALVLSGPLRMLASWPDGWLTALLLPAVVLGLLNWQFFGLACGMVFAFVIPDERLVGLFAVPLLLTAQLRPLCARLPDPLVGKIIDEAWDHRVETTVDTPGGWVVVPLKSRRRWMSAVVALTYLVAGGPAVAGFWGATHTDLPWSGALALLGLAASLGTWAVLGLSSGLPRMSRLMVLGGALGSAALAWGLAVSPVGAVLVSYWSSLGEHDLQLVVPLVLLVADLALLTVVLPLQQRTVGGAVSVVTRIHRVLAHTGVLVLLMVWQPDPVVWPAAATVAVLIALSHTSGYVRGWASEYRPALTDLYVNPGAAMAGPLFADNDDVPAHTIGVWVHDAVLRRPSRPDLTLAKCLLVEEFRTILDDRYSPTLEAYRTLARAGRRPSPMPDSDEQAARWRRLFEMARGAIEATALGGSPHPVTMRRYAILCALAAEFDAMAADRRGLYHQMLVEIEKAAGLWEQADLPGHQQSCQVIRVRALYQLGRRAEAAALAARLDETLDDYRRRDLHLLRAVQAAEDGDDVASRAALDAAASIRISRRTRRAIRVEARVAGMGTAGLRWLFSSSSYVREQSRRLAAARVLLPTTGSEEPTRSQIRAAVRVMPRKSPEWYLMVGIHHAIAGRGVKAYRSHTKAVTLARGQGHTAALQRALYLRATLLAEYGAIEGAKRDLLASVAAQEHIRAAALDAAARIAVGGTAAQVYEYAVQQILAEVPEQPNLVATVTTGDFEPALQAFALSELARSRELVHHLANALPDAADPDLADRFARDRALRDRIEELRGRLDDAGDDDRAALAAELDAARGARDALWDDPAEEAADIAALRTGKPAAYDEIRDLLSR
ncbi:hypothetical protein K1W54_09365 [Micromonospora sp. CPCC 205371]|nr:hypothetical protein [Micromonospora sp. CPCC 205371]